MKNPGIISCSASETIVAIDASDNFVYTNDFGKSFNTLVKGAVDFAFTRRHLFVAVVGLVVVVLQS